LLLKIIPRKYLKVADWEDGTGGEMASQVPEWRWIVLGSVSATIIMIYT
jgi:hypothetical protein